MLRVCHTYYWIGDDSTNMLIRRREERICTTRDCKRANGYLEGEVAYV